MNLEEVFEKLWFDYTNQNPSALKIYNVFKNEGEEVFNDHIAFRTFDDARIDINVLSKVFIERGYVEKGQYEFKEKHLYAKHFEHESDKDAPRVFISQLKTKDFSKFLQETVKQAVDNADLKKLSSDELIFSGNIWGVPSYDTYLKLREESEYAAWVYVYGFRANHLP